MRALIVDDSRAARMLVKRIVVGIGFETLEAQDGRDALDVLAREGAPDLMLVDWNMPVMDGLALVKAVRAERRFADVSIMMVSSENDPRQIARALMAGADEYLIKPIDEPMVVDRLHLLGKLPVEGQLA